MTAMSDVTVLLLTFYVTRLLLRNWVYIRTTRHRSSQLSNGFVFDLPFFLVCPIFLSGRHSIGKYRTAFEKEACRLTWPFGHFWLWFPFCCFAGKRFAILRDRLSRFWFSKLTSKWCPEKKFPLPSLSRRLSLMLSFWEKHHFIKWLVHWLICPVLAPVAVLFSRLMYDSLFSGQLYKAFETCGDQTTSCRLWFPWLWGSFRIGTPFFYDFGLTG